METKEEQIARRGNEIRQCLNVIELADEIKKKAKDKIKRLEADIRDIVKGGERSDRFKTITMNVINRNRELLEMLANGKQEGGH